MSEQQPLTDTFFDTFDLHPSLLSGLHAAGFTRCTPIQALTLPDALAGRDVAGQAQTGTGKTGAFLIAIMQRLLTRTAFAERGSVDPRALIIAPTRELAIQIDKDFRSLGRDTGLKSALIYGGVDYDKQREQLRGGVDIIIATPGRLLDYYKQHVFSLNAVEIMVIDEADRMFDLGFIKDVRFILRRLPDRTRRQCMLFSATLSHRVLELAYEHMNEAQKLAVESDNVTADRVRQVIYFPASEEKLPLLINLLSRIDAHRSMVFVNMKVAAEKVARRLERQGFRVGMLSGDVPQKKRQTLLGKFQRGEIEILIATDVAARGLHIPDVTHVFNYDLPMDAEDYVHRIGRTARLGAEGDAISFACDMYAQGLPDIEAYIGQKIPVARVEPEMLVIPPPRAPVAGAEVGDGESNIDTSARKPHAPKSRHGESRHGDTRKPRRDGPRERAHERKPAPAQATAAPTHSAPLPATSADGAPRKRRRRGGRGRGEGGDVSARNHEGNGTMPEKRPRGHQPIPTTPTPSPPLPAERKKPGLFRRIGNLFKRS
ncbi:MAG: ATP-dependent RNA helicase RhlB [Xanthomonadales bacterium PRO7]|nr:ATP-dependent RNA helicase RhlB [Xanthomonadales bacterium PRO7]HMM56045.1 DEAD/DEAH box helicase [Rudaea sp.]